MVAFLHILHSSIVQYVHRALAGFNLDPSGKKYIFVVQDFLFAFFFFSFAKECRLIHLLLSRGSQIIILTPLPKNIDHEITHALLFTTKKITF